MKRTYVFIRSTTATKFSSNAAQLQHLVIWGWCMKGQAVKRSFTASPELNKQALFAVSNCHTGKLLFLTCSGKDLIHKQWWIQRVTAEATNLADKNRIKRKLDPAWNHGSSLDTWWKPFAEKFVLMLPEKMRERYVAVAWNLSQAATDSCEIRYFTPS